MAVPPCLPGAAQGLTEHRVEVPFAFPFALHLDRPQRQVGAREAVDELRRIGRQSEALQDLVPHHRGGGRRAGQHPGPRQELQQRVELQVVGTEIVAPGTDAVRLVDGHQRALDTRQGSS